MHLEGYTRAVQTNFIMLHDASSAVYMWPPLDLVNLTEFWVELAVRGFYT